MSNVRSVSTNPELLLRHELWRLGFRYKKNDRKLPGSPDIVLPRYRTVIFVHGCFWHGHSNCRKFTIPKTNSSFWIDKISNNRKHDQEVWRKLEAMEWSVIIVWECQLNKSMLDETISKLEAEIHRNGELYVEAKKKRQNLRKEYQQERKIKRDSLIILQKELKEKV